MESAVPYCRNEGREERKKERIMPLKLAGGGSA